MAPGEIIQLSQIPFLDPAELTSGRFLASLTFHDKDWRMWVETQEKGFVEIHGWPAEASYFARTPEKPTDFTTRFLNFMAHNANFIEVMKLFSAIQDDIFNLSAALAKLEIVFQSKDFEQTGGNRMASTEIEYILLICRSIFDLLQETLARIWSKIELTDKTLRKKQLKKSFADMTLRGNAVRTAQDIASQFQLPMCLADCYARQAPVFLKIREYRDNLVHGGQNV